MSAALRARPLQLFARGTCAAPQAMVQSRTMMVGEFSVGLKQVDYEAGKRRYKPGTFQDLYFDKYTWQGRKNIIKLARWTYLLPFLYWLFVKRPRNKKEAQAHNKILAEESMLRVKRRRKELGI